ncbi:hypothetical protein [Streptomyces sirii]|uniref:hypothetical protein n=1 Tax=Streptomyces sirii TaxID=3127701 RepID=UPI003D36BC1B
MALMLAFAVVRSAVAGDEVPVDAGFAELILGLFTLTTPAVPALSALLSRPLLGAGAAR